MPSHQRLLIKDLSTPAPPCETRGRGDERNRLAASWLPLLTAWWVQLGEKPVTVAEIVRVLQLDSPDSSSLLPASVKVACPTKPKRLSQSLGHRLAKLVNRRVGQFVVIDGGHDLIANVRSWRLTKTDAVDDGTAANGGTVINEGTTANPCATRTHELTNRACPTAPLRCPRRLHGVACQYLARRETIELLAPMIYADCDVWKSRELRKACLEDTTREMSISRYESMLRKPICARGGGSISLVGYADVVVTIFFDGLPDMQPFIDEELFDKSRDEASSAMPNGVFDEPIAGSSTRIPDFWRVDSRWRILPEDCGLAKVEFGIVIETRPRSIDRIVRRVAKLRYHSETYEWIVATTYDLLPAEVDALCKSEIFHVRLGKQFEEYVASNKTDGDYDWTLTL